MGFTSIVNELNILALAKIQISAVVVIETTTTKYKILVLLLQPRLKLFV